MKKETKRPIQSKKRYLFAFIIGTLIFILGFSITYSISYIEFQRISNFQDITSYSIFYDKLEHTLFNKDICAQSTFREISEDLGFQGRIIDDLERKFGKDFYNLVELEHFEFINQINKECNNNQNNNIQTILFFYSNKKTDLGKSEDTGRLLGTLSQRNKNLIIYSFDINLDTNIIQQLTDKYNIKTSPTIIINNKDKLENPENINQIEKYLENKESNKDYDDNVIRL